LYFRPGTLDEAVHVLAAHGGQILSGGTDFFPALGDRPVHGSVVDVSGISEIKGITVEPDHIRIGGLTTWSQVISAPLPRCFDALKSAAREIGAIQIQNRGTVAGNLCNASPAADGVPPLLALDAEVELVSAAGSRRMSLANFIVGNRKTLCRPDEILSSVIVPRLLDDARSAFLKLGARRYRVISIAMVAAIVKVRRTERLPRLVSPWDRARPPRKDLPLSRVLWSAHPREPGWQRWFYRNTSPRSHLSMTSARLRVTGAMPPGP